MNFKFRSYDDKRDLGPDKYGNTYRFKEGQHRTDSAWTNISTVLKNGEVYKVPNGGKQRGSFMWIDKDGFIHIVCGKRTNKTDLVNNIGDPFISKVSLMVDHEVDGKWQGCWECYWHNWDRYPLVYIEFLKFTTNCNFLEK